MKNSRRLALDILSRYRPGRGTVSTLLNEQLALAENTPDKGFIRDLVWGVVRYANTIDWTINRFVKRPKDLKPRVHDILRLGAYQILFEQQRIPAYAAVDESVGLARAAAPWASGLVNAVLRALVREQEAKGAGYSRDQFDSPAQWLSVAGAHPVWMVKRWLDRLGEDETFALCSANNAGALLTLRVNTLKTNREAVMSALAAAGVSSEPGDMSPEGLVITSRCELEKIAGYRDGHFVVQDEASQLVARFLDPQPGETILDVCCGSGIKTTHLAQITGNKGRIIAVDSDAGKTKRAGMLAAGMGVSGVEFLPADARQLKDITADRIVIDAPCSGLGVIRRKPDIKWNRSEQDVVSRYPLIQMEIIESCARLLAAGGTMVYATCSTEPEENEYVVESFISRHPGFILSDSRRTWPHRDGVDGFFMAKITKDTK